MAPNESVKMHIIFDLYCKEHPTVDLGVIKYEVFKVKRKGDKFLFKQTKMNLPPITHAGAAITFAGGPHS
ncbi:hypothetical protein Z517_05358 [Fonsecaea pedrosoi CBS 271.37]|uniref:Uncharacterized protein n=1 Tax=Fonsecaea pedrosoi CBS 271.37 TaxID=1442368 RepID=A0A0D2DWW2_9EURO|nr:uncharacterized protein Z517_05358 [Fonsecaea pedrosoi CBS 271.37]KIW82331.1 hypothetical protein Z517_05358 [Fonsecaea pedrosoi CBS 271.37]